MAYFVLLWNPMSDKTVPGTLNKDLQKPRTGSWSCGRSLSVAKDDHVILRRTGSGPKGVVGIGKVMRGSYAAPWSGTKEIGRFVDVEWDWLTEEVMIANDDTRVSALSRFWAAQAGGTKLADEDGELIFELVRDKIRDDLVTPQDPEQRVLYEEGQRMQRTVRGRSSSIRKSCLEKHKAICAVCKFDPIERFGSDFEGLIDIHHLDPIAESEPGRTTDPERDCRPLCPTCHRLAHHKMPPGTCRNLDDIRALIRISS